MKLEVVSPTSRRRRRRSTGRRKAGEHGRSLQLVQQLFQAWQIRTKRDSSLRPTTRGVCSKLLDVGEGGRECKGVAGGEVEQKLRSVWLEEVTDGAGAASVLHLTSAVLAARCASEGMCVRGKVCGGTQSELLHSELGRLLRRCLRRRST